MQRLGQKAGELDWGFRGKEFTPGFLAAKRSSTSALFSPSVRLSVRFKTEFLTVFPAYDIL